MNFFIFAALFSLTLCVVTFIGAANEELKWRRVGFMLMSVLNAFDTGIFFTIIMHIIKSAQ